MYQASEQNKIQLVGFGKTSPGMTLASAEILLQVFDNSRHKHPHTFYGVVITKDDHVTPHELHQLQTVHNIPVFEASHPVPDQRCIITCHTFWNLISLPAKVSMSTSNKSLNKTKITKKKWLVVGCMKGGGLSLLCLPTQLLTLYNLQHVNKALMKSYMTIQCMNVIHLCVEVGKSEGHYTSLCGVVSC